MARKIIVVTAAYGNDHVKSLGGQAAVLPFIANAGADGVEIRRELCSAEELNALPSLAATIERHGLLACYSAPQALFTDNGELNPDLPTLLAEAQTLNALWLKLSLGHFLHNQQLDELRDILSDSGMALVVENDQTDCGQLAPMQRFKAACRVHQLPITLTKRIFATTRRCCSQYITRFCSSLAWRSVRCSGRYLNGPGWAMKATCRKPSRNIKRYLTPFGIRIATRRSRRR